MMIEPTNEIGDHFGLKDVRNPVSYFQEAPNVALKELSYPLVDPSQVMLCCWPFVGRLVVLNQHSLEVVPRVNDIG